MALAILVGDAVFHGVARDQSGLHLCAGGAHLPPLRPKPCMAG